MRKRTTSALAGASLVGVALVAIACASAPAAPSGESTPTGEGGAPSPSPNSSSSSGALEASVDPSVRFQGPRRVKYTQFGFGAPPGSCDARIAVAADLDARTLVSQSPSCGDGGSSDAGAAVTRSTTLSEADAQSLRALVEALRRDPNASTTCNGFDGTEKEFAVTTATETFTVRTGWNCSNPSAPDVIVEEAGFDALHAKLMTLAGLDPSFPPT